MIRIILSLFVILSLVMSGFASLSYGLSCAPSTFGEALDQSEYVFHGMVISKNYLMYDTNTAIITFEILESFKGETNKQITIFADEDFDYYQFEVGFEYVVYLYGGGLFLETGPCSIKYPALPSILQIIRESTIHRNDFHDKLTYTVFETLDVSDQEQLEDIRKAVLEKRVERWDYYMFERQMFFVTIISLFSAPLVGGFTGYFLTKRKDKKI